MKTIRVYLTCFAVLLGFCLQGQIDVKGKIKEKTKERLEQRTDQGIDKGLDKIEEGAGKLVKGKDKQKDGDKETPSEKEPAKSGVDKSSKGNPEDTIRQKLVSVTEYDFIPGDQILFFEDFSQDKIGDFPALWASNGSGEVKTLNLASGKWLHLNGDDAVYCFTKEIQFPANFIVEFDIIPDADYSSFELTLYADPDSRELTDDLYPGSAGVHIDMNIEGWITKGYKEDLDWLNGESRKNPVVAEKVNHVIVWVQNRRLRIYHDGAKVLDVVANIHQGVKFNRFRYSGWDRNSKPYVSNFKITTAAPDTRHKLMTEGKIVTYGITFDSGKDVVKPESHATIKEIADVLKENPQVRIQITGHTDSDGNDQANLSLSERRAANVKLYLTSQFGIDAARIETKGMGESQHLASNDTPENKAKNRRVEIIKL